MLPAPSPSRQYASARHDGRRLHECGIQDGEALIQAGAPLVEIEVGCSTRELRLGKPRGDVREKRVRRSLSEAKAKTDRSFALTRFAGFALS